MKATIARICRGGGAKALLVTALVLCICVLGLSSAHADDFSNSSGLFDIVFVKRLANGNIIAIDDHGRVATFDYLSWEIISNGSFVGAVRKAGVNFDDSNNTVIFTVSSDGGWSSSIYVYNIASNSWPVRDLKVAEGSYRGFSHGGQLYVAEISGSKARIRKWNGSSWVDFTYSGEITGLEGLRSFDYDEKAGKAYFLLSDAWDDCKIAVFNFATNQWSYLQPPKWSDYWRDIKVLNGQIFLCRYYGGGMGLWQYSTSSVVVSLDDDYYSWPYLLSTSDFVSFSIDSTTSTRSDGVYITGIGRMDLPFAGMVACYDKYGYLVIAGKGGRIIVRDKSGTLHTDTSVYSEFAIHDAKTAAERAEIAANAAKQAAEQAKTNTVYTAPGDPDNGKSAAVLAKEAKDAVKQVVAQMGPQIVRVKGLNNATCTRSSSFSVVVDANNATEFRACVDGGTWTNWVPAGSTATVTGLYGTGARTIRVEVRNAAGAVATGQMTVFKL